MKRGKSYKAVLDKVDRDKVYSPAESVRFIKENPTAKFDESIEIHIRLGVDPKQSDQKVRGTVVLPYGTGKTVRVIAFAQGEKYQEAVEAGADKVGQQDLADEIAQGWSDFDIVVATPDTMSIVGKLGKILSTRMPNPKAGTVTFEIGKAIKDIKAGKIEFKLDRYGIIHAVIGRRSFEISQLLENYETLIREIVRAKPPTAKGRYLKSINMASTMGPSVKVDTSKTTDLHVEAES